MRPVADLQCCTFSILCLFMGTSCCTVETTQMCFYNQLHRMTPGPLCVGLMEAASPECVLSQALLDSTA